MSNDDYFEDTQEDSDFQDDEMELMDELEELEDLEMLEERDIHSKADSGSSFGPSIIFLILIVVFLLWIFK
ncbi:MAG: hypothetical protein K6G63_05060 [Eubacterium sp.]|nr:hypothetical protein [Eubacterium sp.]